MADEPRQAPPGQPGGEPFRQFLESNPEDVFKRLDTDRDGKIELSELPDQARERFQRLMDDFDANRLPIGAQAGTLTLREPLYLSSVAWLDMLWMHAPETLTWTTSHIGCARRPSSRS